MADDMEALEAMLDAKDHADHGQAGNGQDVMQVDDGHGVGGHHGDAGAHNGDTGDRKRHRDDGDRHRDRDRDRERDRRKDGEREHKKKRHHRSKSRERGGGEDRERRHKSGHRSRSRDKDRDRKKDKHRSRSRSHRSKRERGDSRDRKPRDKGFPPPPFVPPVVDELAHLTPEERELLRIQKDAERAEERRKREAEREEQRRLQDLEREEARKQAAIDELTKDQRTVFVSQLTLKVSERDLKKYFEKVGRVNNVQMIRDKFTNRHKGFAYVEMKDLESIPDVLILNNVVPDFQKFPVLVKASEAEKNYLAKVEEDQKAEQTAMQAAAEQAAGIYSSGAQPKNKLYVGNLHPNITETDLLTILQQFGDIENVTLHRDEQGQSKGYAFVIYKSQAGAVACQEKLDGLDIAGKALKVNFVQPEGAASAASGNWKLDDDDGMGMKLNAASRATLMARLGQAAGMLGQAGSPPPGLPGLPGVAGFQGGFNALNPAVSGMPLSSMMGLQAGLPMSLAAMNPALAAAQAAQQAGLQMGMGMGLPGMNPLAAFGGAAAATAAARQAIPIPPIKGIPSFCILVHNMFDPATETEEGWELDIKDDVEDECSKHGSVMHSYVESRAPGGLVYVMFSTGGAATKSAEALNGRWFAGRMITVEYLTPAAYTAKFPEATKAAQTAMATAANAVR